MAFGRSNSLSINTGLTNSLFQTAPKSQGTADAKPKEKPPSFYDGNEPVQFAAIPENTAQGDLARAAQAVARDIAASDDPSTALTDRVNLDRRKLIHDSNQQPPQQQAKPASSSLFPTNNPSQQSNQSATSSLFPPANPAQPNLSSGNSLFSNTNASQQPQQQQQPPLNNTSSIFGAPANNNASVFGSGGSTNAGSSVLGGGGGFGTTQQQTTGSLFGGGGGVGSTQPQTANSLFGGGGGAGATQQQTTNSLFGGGGSAGATQQQTTSSLFGSLQRAPASVSTNSAPLFGSVAHTQASQPPSLQQAAPSLLSATLRTQSNQRAPFGRLTMGQSASAPGPSIGAAKIDPDNLRGTTRFEDCIDPVREELEKIDKMIRQQESWCRQIEAFLPKHEQDVRSLAPDGEFVKDKAEAVEQCLAGDAQDVETQRKATDKDHRDLDRCERVVTNLALPAPYQYSGMGGTYSLGPRTGAQQSQPTGPDGEALHTYDTDLIGNYFNPMAVELQKTMNAYANNLVEIESHMRVIESSAAGQSQQLVRRRTGIDSRDGSSNSDNTVRELAETLRGFEGSILGVAGAVGECREGVNELILGRYGGGSVRLV